MISLSPQDALALQIGRCILDLAIAKQTALDLQRHAEDLEARLVKYEKNPDEAAEPAE